MSSVSVLIWSYLPTTCLQPEWIYSEWDHWAQLMPSVEPQAWCHARGPPPNPGLSVVLCLSSGWWTYWWIQPLVKQTVLLPVHATSCHNEIQSIWEASSIDLLHLCNTNFTNYLHCTIYVLLWWNINFYPHPQHSFPNLNYSVFTSCPSYDMSTKT